MTRMIFLSVLLTFMPNMVNAAATKAPEINLDKIGTTAWKSDSRDLQTIGKSVVANRSSLVAEKPGNAGGGKEPQFKVNVRSGPEPVAGWNDSCRAGFEPAEDARLCTAHSNLTTRAKETSRSTSSRRTSLAGSNGSPSATSMATATQMWSWS
jgi:hypothetical protein